MMDSISPRSTAPYSKVTPIFTRRSPSPAAPPPRSQSSSFLVTDAPPLPITPTYAAPLLRSKFSWSEERTPRTATSNPSSVSTPSRSPGDSLRGYTSDNSPYRYEPGRTGSDTRLSSPFQSKSPEIRPKSNSFSSSSPLMQGSTSASALSPKLRSVFSDSDEEEELATGSSFPTSPFGRFGARLGYARASPPAQIFRSPDYGASHRKAASQEGPVSFLRSKPLRASLPLDEAISPRARSSSLSSQAGGRAKTAASAASNPPPPTARRLSFGVRHKRSNSGSSDARAYSGRSSSESATSAASASPDLRRTKGAVEPAPFADASTGIVQCSVKTRSGSSATTTGPLLVLDQVPKRRKSFLARKHEPLVAQTRVEVPPCTPPFSNLTFTQAAVESSWNVARTDTLGAPLSSAKSKVRSPRSSFLPAAGSFVPPRLMAAAASLKYDPKRRPGLAKKASALELPIDGVRIHHQVNVRRSSHDHALSPLLPLPSPPLPPAPSNMSKVSSLFPAPDWDNYDVAAGHPFATKKFTPPSRPRRPSAIELERIVMEHKALAQAEKSAAMAEQRQGLRSAISRRPRRAPVPRRLPFPSKPLPQAPSATGNNSDSRPHAPGYHSRGTSAGSSIMDPEPPLPRSPRVAKLAMVSGPSRSSTPGPGKCSDSDGEVDRTITQAPSARALCRKSIAVQHDDDMLDHANVLAVDATPPFRAIITSVEHIPNSTCLSSLQSDHLDNVIIKLEVGGRLFVTSASTLCASEYTQGSAQGLGPFLRNIIGVSVTEGMLQDQRTEASCNPVTQRLKTHQANDSTNSLTVPAIGPTKHARRSAILSKSPASSTDDLRMTFDSNIYQLLPNSGSVIHFEAVGSGDISASSEDSDLDMLYTSGLDDDDATSFDSHLFHSTHPFPLALSPKDERKSPYDVVEPLSLPDKKSARTDLSPIGMRRPPTLELQTTSHAFLALDSHRSASPHCPSDVESDEGDELCSSTSVLCPIDTPTSARSSTPELVPSRRPSAAGILAEAPALVLTAGSPIQGNFENQSPSFTQATMAVSGAAANSSVSRVSLFLDRHPRPYTALLHVLRTGKLPPTLIVLDGRTHGRTSSTEVSDEDRSPERTSRRRKRLARLAELRDEAHWLGYEGVVNICKQAEAEGASRAGEA